MDLQLLLHGHVFALTFSAVWQRLRAAHRTARLPVSELFHDLPDVLLAAAVRMPVPPDRDHQLLIRLRYPDLVPDAVDPVLLAESYDLVVKRAVQLPLPSGRQDGRPMPSQVVNVR